MAQPLSDVPDLSEVPVDDRWDPPAIVARGTQELDPFVVRSSLTANVDAEMLESDLAEIVHDLKAPLSTLALEVTLLDHRIAAGEAVEARPILARVLRNVDFLDRMIQDLLDGWSREPMIGLRTSTELRDLLQSVIARSVPTKDQTRVRLDAPRGVVVRIDDLRIQRVVGNLLSNALKYSPAKSAIVVRLDAYSDHCCVSVIDSGAGVTQAEAGFIFDKYRRTSSARMHSGSGLGLYVSRKIIEDHGGTMGVESVPGAGSRFFFHIALS